MRKFIVFLLLMGLFTNLLAQNQIESYEYWFDEDETTRATQLVTGQGNTSIINAQIGAAMLSKGLHSLHIRFKDNIGKWSAVSSEFFIKTASTTVAQYEYWFDEDETSRTTRLVTSQDNNSIINTQIDADLLSKGLHSLHIRFKDNSGKWSAVSSQFFIKTASATVIQYEYWFDEDETSRTTQSVTDQGNISIINALIGADMLSKGLHSLHIRFKDNIGKWSAVSSQFFIKTASTTVVQYE